MPAYTKAAPVLGNDQTEPGSRGHTNGHRSLIGYRKETILKSTSVTVEEHIRGDTKWVAVRARGAEWSWLTPAEAAELGRLWVEKYGLAARTILSPLRPRDIPG